MQRGMTYGNWEVMEKSFFCNFLMCSSGVKPRMIPTIKMFWQRLNFDKEYETILLNSFKRLHSFAAMHQWVVKNVLCNISFVQNQK